MLGAEIVALTLLLGGVLGQAPEEPFIDVGACPFECCQYGAWISMDEVPLYAEPDANADLTGTLSPGVRVNAITGEVHTAPGEFKVHRKHGRYRPGDVIKVYTYLGEGVFRVKFGDEIYEEQLGFGPAGINPDGRCSDHASCFEELSEELEYVWWTHLELPDGSVAWTRDGELFRGNDACGD